MGEGFTDAHGTDATPRAPRALGGVTGLAAWQGAPAGEMA
jgi:hypothetical protein